MKKRIDETAKYSGQYASVTVSADSLEVDFDAIKADAGPANAIVDAIREDISNNETVSAAALKRRRKAGASGTAKWDATGRLKSGIRAVKSGGGFDIVPPDDRLNSDELFNKFVEDLEADPSDNRKFEAATAIAADRATTVGRRSRR